MSAPSFCISLAINSGENFRRLFDLVGKFLVIERKDSSLHLDYGRRLALELSYQELSCIFRFDDVSTGKDINGGVGILGPGMDGEMRFGDDHHSAYPEWIEFME